MLLLFDSSSAIVKLTLIEGDSRSDYQWQADRQLAVGLLQFLRDKLREHHKDFTDVKGIGVFKGPGSYTGLRIGLSVLNTLAESMAIPIIGAQGEQWQQLCQQRLDQNENDLIVLPNYGGEAHITLPKK